MELKIKRIDERARIPTYGSHGAAAFDLYSVSTGILHKDEPSLTFNTCLCVEVPEGFALMIYSRSGHAFGQDVRLANAVGVIDSDYRGCIMVKLTLDGSKPVFIKEGDRIAQAMLIPVPHVTFCEVTELSETVRGEGGFGSTGA